MNRTGVYEIRCTVNGKVYVGSAAVSLEKRWAQHKSNLRGGYHESRHLQASWTKYGEASFEFSIIEECPPEDCITREQFWIDNFNASDRSRGFNLSPKAGSTLGYKHSDASRKAMGESRKGKKLSPEHCRAISEGHKASLAPHSNKGKTFTLAHRMAISSSQIGRKPSEATRQAISVALKGRTIGPFSESHRNAISESLKGRKLSERHCENMKGRIVSEATRKAISNGNKGKRLNEETRKRMSEAKKGKPKSEAHIKKMSEATTRLWARRRAQKEACQLTLPFVDEDCQIHLHENIDE